MKAKELIKLQSVSVCSMIVKKTIPLKVVSKKIGKKRRKS